MRATGMVAECNILNVDGPKPGAGVGGSTATLGIDLRAVLVNVRELYSSSWMFVADKQMTWWRKDLSIKWWRATAAVSSLASGPSTAFSLGHCPLT